MYIYIHIIHIHITTPIDLRPSSTSSGPCRCCLGGCGTGLGSAAVARQKRNWEDVPHVFHGFSRGFLGSKWIFMGFSWMFIGFNGFYMMFMEFS